MESAGDRHRLIYVRDGGCCTYCHRALRPDEAQLDHDHPGVHPEHVALEDLRVACPDCRTEKGARTAGEYRAARRASLAREMLHHLAGRGGG